MGANWIELPMVRRPALSDVAALRALRRLLSDYDLVHLHSSKAGVIGRIAAATVAKPPPVVFTPHGWSWYSSGLLGWAYKLVERWAARHGQVIVAVSEEELDDGRRVLGDRGHLVLIRNGVDTERFQPASHNRADRLIVCVGRLCHQKGQDRLIRALALSPREDLQVRLIGDGPDRESLMALACDLRVSDRVEFGGQADPLRHFQEASLVVVPSRWEGFPLALLEAMACGAPILATRFGGVSAVARAIEVIEQDGSEDQLVSHMAKRIDSLLGDQELRAAMSARTRVAAVERFSLEDCLSTYSAMWLEAVESR
jgi:glycosyltransferase involved in cell wall biosynthesis